MIAKTIRARYDGTRNIYIHNDLINAAHHYKQRIEQRLKDRQPEGVTFDCMSCLVMLAFSIEAFLNLFGHKLIIGWNERWNYDKKRTVIIKRLGLAPDFTKDPYKCLDTLKLVRDTLAHGKPIEETFNEIVVRSQSEIEREIDLDHGWEKYCTPQNAIDTFNNVDAIWNELLKASGLRVYDTITHGDSGLTVLEIVESAAADKA
jgi:hypothetical protein